MFNISKSSNVAERFQGGYALLSISDSITVKEGSGRGEAKETSLRLGCLKVVEAFESNIRSSGGYKPKLSIHS